jgi:hypothetical protein
MSKMMTGVMPPIRTGQGDYVRDDWCGAVPGDVAPRSAGLGGDHGVTAGVRVITEIDGLRAAAKVISCGERGGVWVKQLASEGMVGMQHDRRIGQCWPVFNGDIVHRTYTREGVVVTCQVIGQDDRSVRLAASDREEVIEIPWPVFAATCWATRARANEVLRMRRRNGFVRFEPR